jgi:hypothetical protein
MSGSRTASRATRAAARQRVRRQVFPTRLQFRETPIWHPLEQVARLSRQSDELPSFHEVEFMYMAAVWNSQRRLRIHLYKHRDTRRYLNLDDTGHAYEFCGPVPGREHDPGSGGLYRLARSLGDAVTNADLWIFEREPGFLFRSSPPEHW